MAALATLAARRHARRTRRRGCSSRRATGPSTACAAKADGPARSTPPSDPAARRRATPDPADVVAEADALAVPDDRLRLIFTCCHPALAPEAQVALTLRTLGGLTTPEVARAFLVPEATMAQRIVRAKAKIAERRHPLRGAAARRPARARSTPCCRSCTSCSTRATRPPRATSWCATSCAARPCDSAACSCRAAARRARGRRAARAHAAARRPAGDAGRRRTARSCWLGEQDRTRWDRAQIAEGVAPGGDAPWARAASAATRCEAAIAALHAEAPTADATDWPQIAALYGVLHRLAPSPVVALNRAVAVAMADGPDCPGCASSTSWPATPGLERLHLYHSTRGLPAGRARPA